MPRSLIRRKASSLNSRVNFRLSMTTSGSIKTPNSVSSEPGAGQRVLRCAVDDPVNLENLLGLFFSYERSEIAEFRKAIEQFKSDLPHVLAALRDMIETAELE